MKRARLDWIGLTLILWSVLTRAAVGSEPLPGWDADPTQMSIAIIGIGPAGSLVLDVLAWLGAACVFLGQRPRRTGTDPLTLTALLGAICILARTLIVDGADTEAVRIGSSWAAGWVGFSALLTLASRSALRTVAGALLAGFVLYLCSKAFIQVFFEHASMLAQFEADPAASLTAQGFEPGSPQALSYERRLRQPDPTGWFGLSNVLASFFAAGVVLMAYSAAQAAGKARMVFGLAALTSCGLLLTTGSKAGLAVACVGIGLIVLTRFIHGPLARAAGLAALAIPITAVVFRGLSGVPSNDLSLLVRWFYMQGAVRITGSELPLGTGPTGFQEIYMRVKPPEGTEDVISPHLIWLDYSASLGLVAVPLLLALAWVVWRMSSQVAQSERVSFRPSEARLRMFRPYFVLVLIAPVLVGAWLEMQATPIETAASRLVGVLAWAGVSLVLLWSGLPTRRGMAFAGVVLVCHAELDMNMSLPGSAPLVLAVLALAAGPQVRRSMKLPTLPLVLLPAVTAAVLLAATLPIWQWESTLRRSSARLSSLVEMREDMLAEGQPPEAFAGLQERFDAEGQLSLAELVSAFNLMPRDSRVSKAASRLAMTLANSASSVLDREMTLEFMTRAEQVLDDSLRSREKASLHAQLARVRLDLARQLREGPVRESRVPDLQAAAIAGLERAAELAPYNSRYPATLAFVLEEMGHAEAAGRWAAEALDRDAFSGLDPLMALPDRTRRRLARLARNP